MSVQTAQQYTLGRGELNFARFKTGTQNTDGELYFGNTPEFSLTFAPDTLDHFSSDHGIKEKDDSVVLQVNRSGAFTTDNVNPANLALMFFGDDNISSVSAGASLTYSISNIQPGFSYQIGTSDTYPSGQRKTTVASVIEDVGSSPDTYVANTDYVVDVDLGRIDIPIASAIPPGTNVVVHYAVAAHTISRIISGSQPIEGAIRYIAFNPVGPNFDYYLPWVKLTPNGDYALKGDTWQTIPFKVDVLKRTDQEALYVDGRAII